MTDDDKWTEYLECVENSYITLRAHWNKCLGAAAILSGNHVRFVGYKDFLVQCTSHLG